MNGLGASGGSAASGAPASGGDGLGPGAGSGAVRFNFWQGGSGGAIYGDSDLPTTTWANLYGSGGGGGSNGDNANVVGAGGGGAGHSAAGIDGNDASDGPGVAGTQSGAGGAGGGAIRIYASIFDNINGYISADAENGANHIGAGGGGGGGGSGGTVYIETFNGTLGIDVITVAGGAGGQGGGGGVGTDGGAGSDGRIHIESSNYTGVTCSPVIDYVP